MKNERKRVGWIPAIWVWLFGRRESRTPSERRKGKLQRKRNWGILLLIGINVVPIVAGSPLFSDYPVVVGILNVIGAGLTAIGIVVHKVQTFSLKEAFAEVAANK